MSIPPQLIRVKRKRIDEAPVTFLQFDAGVKRHRSGSNWVYQRRQLGPQSPTDAPVRFSRDVNPVIHVSNPDEEHPHQKKHHVPQDATQTPATSGLQQPGSDKLAEPRRFHISRKMMTPIGTRQSTGGVSKKVRYGPAVFVERSRTTVTPKAQRSLDSSRVQTTNSLVLEDQTEHIMKEAPVEERRLKKPGVKARARSPQPNTQEQSPLPPSVMRPHSEDMAKIAADMNDWVLKEIGENLQNMEREKQAEKVKFKPKAPARRYQQRHPEAAHSALKPNGATDTAMNDFSDVEDEDEWVIEEYVRIPAHAMTLDVAPTDVGLLVLDGEEDSNLFFGPENDSDDDMDEDDEDENAENYYTADYPEDEVESDDEYGRHAYGYRNGNASDEEEFDNVAFEDNDEMVLEGDDDDATMARIKAYMKRSRAFK